MGLEVFRMGYLALKDMFWFGVVASLFGNRLSGNEIQTLHSFLGHSDYTDRTIGFFEKHSLGRMETERFGSDNLIAKHQTNLIKIKIGAADLEDIPEKIEPGIAFSWLLLLGSTRNKPSTTPKELVARITKLLLAFSEVHVNRLAVTMFRIPQEDLPATAQTIPLSIRTDLWLGRVSPGFLVWFCESVDLSACSEGIGVRLFNCETKSIACMENLGIQNLLGLYLSGLHNLERFDYLLPGEGHSKNKLILKGVFDGLQVSIDVAATIVESAWKEVSMDMKVLQSICRAAGKGMLVAELIFLSVTDVHSLCFYTDSQQSVRAEILVIEDHTKTDLLSKAFFDSAMEWIYTKTENVQDVYILTKDKQTEHALEACLAADALIYIARMPGLKYLVVNDCPVQLHPKPHQPEEGWCYQDMALTPDHKPASDDK
ncbi:hypothetical protein NEDG_01319 [Nematocida displodere]|uniref:Uncharacterized protein n=1 Tax=Nematocida displodere TaxID=1805483 RepID=A0A177EBY9_9MICR|nr:hypothetical protein NEDG_01319 [Nematocida displodere]